MKITKEELIKEFGEERKVVESWDSGECSSIQILRDSVLIVDYFWEDEWVVNQSLDVPLDTLDDSDKLFMSLLERHRRISKLQDKEESYYA